MSFCLFWTFHLEQNLLHLSVTGRPGLVFQLDLYGLHCVNEYMWFQISVTPTPPLLPSPLQGWTCVSWCRSSSVPADYSMSYDSMGTAAVGIRQAAGPHLHPPPSSTGPPSSALLVRDWSQPLYQGWVILELGLFLTTSPLFTLSISWRLEWVFHCCTRVIATCYQEGNTVFIRLIFFKVFKPCCMTVCVNISVPAILFGIQNCSTLEVTPRMAVSDGQTVVLVLRGVWHFWQEFNNMWGTWRVYRDLKHPVNLFRLHSTLSDEMLIGPH